MKTMFASTFYYAVYDENDNELFAVKGDYTVESWVGGQG